MRMTRTILALAALAFGVLLPVLATAAPERGTREDAQALVAKAVAAFNEALRLQPDLYLAYQNLGSVRKNQGRLSEAETALRAAIRLKPHAAEFHLDLAEALSEPFGFHQGGQRASPDRRLSKNHSLWVCKNGTIAAL